jgi:hypothetical protein
MMNRDLMQRQMFRNGGGVVPMQDGGEPTFKEKILAVGRGVVPMAGGGAASMQTLSREDLQLFLQNYPGYLENNSLYDERGVLNPEVRKEVERLKEGNVKYYDPLRPAPSAPSAPSFVPTPSRQPQVSPAQIQNFLRNNPGYLEEKGSVYGDDGNVNPEVDRQLQMLRRQELLQSQPGRMSEQEMEMLRQPPVNPEVDRQLQLLRRQELLQSQPGRMSEQEMEMLRRQAPVYGMQEGGMAPMGMPPQGMAPQGAMMPEMAQAQQAGMDPAILEQMLAQASQGIGSLDEAEDYEQVMNMMTGTSATIAERRMELADLVGDEDAQQTPDSVLTLVQPVIMMAKTDEGIGGLAQDQMTEAVTGDMAGGIMSTIDMGAQEGPAPVNFRYGGAVQYFAPVNANRVAGNPLDIYAAQLSDNTELGRNLDMSEQQFENAMSQSQARPEEIFTQQQKVLSGLFNTEEEKKLAQQRADERKNMTQAQMFFDLANTGLAIAAPGPRTMSIAEKLAYAAQQTELFPKIGQRAATLAEQKNAEEARIKEQQRALDLTAYGTSSQLYQQEVGDLRSSFQKSIERAYDTEDQRVKGLTDFYTEQLKQEAQTIRENAKNEKDFQNQITLKGIEIRANPVRDDLVDPETGMKIAYEIRGVLGKDLKITSEYVIPKINGKPIVTAPADVEIAYLSDGSGNKQMYTRVKGQDKAEFKPYLLNGQPLYSDVAQFKWQEGFEDGEKVFNLVNQTTGDTKTTQKISPELDIRNITSRGRNLLVSVDKKGNVKTIFTGEGENKHLTIGKTILELNPETGSVTPLYTAEGEPTVEKMADGRLAYAYPISEENPEGKLVPIHGSVEKASTYDYETWIDPDTKENLTLFRVNKGREVYYADLEDNDGNVVQVDPSELRRLTPISKETAYDASVALYQAAEAREEYLETLMELYGDRLEDPETFTELSNAVNGPALKNVGNKSGQKSYTFYDHDIGKIVSSKNKEDVKESLISELEFVRDNYNEYANFAKDIKDGTGFFNKLRVFGGKTTSIFGVDGFWTRNVEANNAVRAISLSLRMAAANSPRLAEGEQVRLAEIMASADKWFTSGTIELQKASVLKRQINSELLYITEQLANNRGTLSKPVVTALQQSKVALQQARRVMSVILPYGTERVRRSNEVKGRIEGAKEEQRNQ